MTSKEKLELRRYVKNIKNRVLTMKLYQQQHREYVEKAEAYIKNLEKIMKMQDELIELLKARLARYEPVQLTTTYTTSSTEQNPGS